MFDVFYIAISRIKFVQKNRNFVKYLKRFVVIG